MQELEAIVEAYDDFKKKGQACVLATVVHVEGSSYRRAGARMLVSKQGEMVGAISGGCLEGDALKKALLALHQRQNKLITYDTNDEEDAAVGLQLGCNGVIQILFEPIETEQPNNPVELIKKVIKQKAPAVVVTFFNLEKNKQQIGTRLFFDEKAKLRLGVPMPEPLQTAVKADVEGVLKTQTSRFVLYQGEAENYYAFFEIALPPLQLVLVGAGNDAQAVVQMATLLGWRVAVVDGRPSHANPQRFQGGCQVVVAKPEKILDSFPTDQRTAFVLMTHNYQYDLAVLKCLLLQQPLPSYVGILGTKKKFFRMLDDLQTQGFTPTADQRAAIYAPVGLDLRAETAPEIALSILSEILAVFNAAPTGHLRTRQGAIHDKTHQLFQIQPL